MDDNRRIYRIETDPDEGIDVEILTRGADTFSAKLVDASAYGVAVVFAPWEAPEISAGDAIGLHFRFPETGDSVWVEGVARYIQSEDVYLRCGLEITSGNLRQKLDDRSWEVFNRRRSPRAHLGAGSTVRVAMALENGTRLPDAWLYDVSTYGMCLRVAGNTAPHLEEVERFVARFTLPGQWVELDLVGVLVDVRDGFGHLLVGVEFDTEATEGYDEIHAILADFVARSIVFE